MKFVSSKTKDTVIASRRKLKETKIVIKEDLTKARLDLLRRAQEKVGFRNVWSVNGKFFVNINDRKLLLTKISDLSMLD